MQNTDSLSRAIHAARAGQLSLARFHCQQAAKMQSDDPLVWLWLAWLSDSPASMHQCLQVAQNDARYSEIAKAGIVFARALCGIETDCDSSPGGDSDRSGGSAPPLRISDTLEDGDVTDTVVALPGSPASVTDEPPPTLQPESVEVATAVEPILETEPEQQCVEALNELSAAVNGEEAFGAETRAFVNTADAPLHPNTELFAVAQAMLGDSQGNEESVDGLAAGVSVTSDPWAVRSVNELSEIDNSEIQEARAADQITSDPTVESASPAWAKNLTSCDDQSEWSAQADEFIPVAESASAVETEALAAEENRPEDRVEDNRTGVATGLESGVANAAQKAGIDVGTEQDVSPGDNKAIPTVLVVDDSPAVRRLVQITLRGRGYNIVTAFDGVAAIKEIARHEPWLILLDITMPRLDGYQLCSLIRKHERTQHIPVVMLSGEDGVFDPTRGKMVGCSSYIAKPFASEALIEEVEKHIGEYARATQ